MQGFQTRKGNIIFQENNQTLIFLKEKQRIQPFTNYHGESNYIALPNHCKLIEFDLDAIKRDLSPVSPKKQIHNMFNEIVMKEVNDIVAIKSSLIKPCVQKLSIKEKNLLKRQLFGSGRTYFIGEFTSTDSYKRKGGWFGSSTSTVADCGYYNNGAYYNENDKEIISSRKKNYTVPRNVDFKDFLKFVVSKKEAVLQVEFDKKRKQANAEIMLANPELFKAELMELLTK